MSFDYEYRIHHHQSLLRVKDSEEAPQKEGTRNRCATVIFVWLTTATHQIETFKFNFYNVVKK